MYKNVNGTTTSAENLKQAINTMGETISKLKQEKNNKSREIRIKSLELDFTLVKGIIDSLDKD